MGLIITTAVALLVLGGLLGLISWRSDRSSSYRPSTASPAPASTTATAGTPTPPATAAKSYGWAWLIVGILAIVFVIWVIAPMVTKTTTPPQATVPKKELKEYVVRRPLEFLGGERIIRRQGYVEILKGGYATFRATSLPIKTNGRYKVVFHAKRITTGRDWLEINAGKGNGAPFCFEYHYASDDPIKIAFFEECMPGEAKYFCPNDNFLKLWADNDLFVQLDKQPYVEITYEE